MKRVGDVIWRRRRSGNEALLDKMKELSWNVGAGYHMPEDQSLEFKFLPLCGAEVARPHS